MIEYGDVRLKYQKEKVGALNISDRSLLRDLAKRVVELASDPKQDLKKELWKKHNTLSGTRPMILVFPEGAWKEMLPLDSMEINDPFWKSYEWYLKRLVYRGEKITDDNIIEPVIEISLVYSISDWGIPIVHKESSIENGAWGFDPVINHPDDFYKLKYPEIIIDEETTERNYQCVNEILGDIVDIKVYRNITVDISIIGELVQMRGLEQILMDMIDRPKWMHEVLGFMQNGLMNLLDYIENNIIIDLNNGNDYIGTGGIGYTDELPGESFDGAVKLKHLWGNAETQEFGIVSPTMYKEFAVEYQIPLLKRFGLNCYGCCEVLDDKFDVVKSVPNLRRISISPWTNLIKAVGALENKYIFSWKANPNQVSSQFNEELIRKNIKDVIEITKDCNLEIILKDTHTIGNCPERIEKWVDIVRETVEGGLI
ncbi:hypothetical protein C4577_06310 [Candidatus Parcubacteria bacterium]|nr:MAG: hypothetical protein C4577_06310 [Candidatus Parcubacteria bacterium]